MTYKNFFQSKVVDCETDSYDIQVLKILIAIKESQVKANYESMTSLGGYTQFGKNDESRKHYTENLTNHSGNNNFKEIAIQSAIAKQYNKFEAIGKASSPSFFSYHIISGVKGGEC